MQNSNLAEKESASTLPTIVGVEFKDLRSFPDQRGYFREVVRSSDDFFANGFAQWSHSCMQHNTVKAWHFHHRQIDWWYCGLGVLDVALYDARPESPSAGELLNFRLGQEELHEDARCAVVRIPQGVLHGCRVLSEQAHLFYITSEHYNPEDEGRIPFNADEIPFCWGKEEELIVSDKDKELFLPPHPRALLNSQ